MEFVPRIIYTVLMLLSASCATWSQQCVLRYRERGVAQEQVPLLFSHGSTSPLYFAMSRVGVFTLSGASLTPIEVTGMQNADGYEYQYLSDCSGGDYLLHQRGFLGHRLTRLDSQGIAHKLLLPKGEASSIGVLSPGVGFVSYFDTVLVVRTDYLTLDCGQTWFEVSGSLVDKMRGAALLQKKEPVGFSMARASLGNEVYASAVKTGNGMSSCSILGEDSLVWIARRNRTALPDTIWYANIRDSSKKRFDTVLQVNGLSVPVTEMTDLELVASTDGIAFVFHKSGWYARYKEGYWSVVDSLPPIEQWGINVSSTTSRSKNVITYLSNVKSGRKLVTVYLDSLNRDKQSVTLDPAPGALAALKTVNSEYTVLFWNQSPQACVLYSDSGKMQLLNSAARDIEVLPITPILFGFTSKLLEPILVPCSDYVLLANESGIGNLKALVFRGESWRSTKVLGPRIQSTRGLRTPFIGTDEVISPGDKVRQFTRDGRFVQVLRDKPATAVFRMPDTTLVVADGANVTVVRAGGTVDSVSLTSVLCSTSGVAGYVNSITMAADGSLLAFTNGLRLLDLETLGTKPWRCGGIVRSLDTGRTWVQSTTPIETPYFLGSIRTPTGAIVASATTVVRDTTPQASDDDNPAVESKNHTFNDRRVIRTTDNGSTWTQVYHSPSNSSLKFIGGDGTITKDGTLLLMTTDGVLQSTNDGLDWDFRDITGLEAGSQNVISMFQDTVGSAVYYCTINGLYEEQPLTTVHEENSTATNVHAARTWENHLSAWKKSGIKIRRLFSVLGYEVTTVNPPAGLYLAEYELHSETKIEPILVLVD
ncbi:MAG: hypothetical protein HQ472_00335 [Ignavibacteria bacterium]|nr:hypothetical protein [Ignavibacteria bacterium]